MEVHIGPRNARHTVEPEAGYGGEISFQRHKEIVLVCHVLVVVAEEELGKRLDLEGQVSSILFLSNERLVATKNSKTVKR
jgi:hypothetical protein